MCSECIEIATTDILTDGRLEVGLGAGHMKWEFDQAGIPWEPCRAAEYADIIAIAGAPTSHTSNPSRP